MEAVRATAEGATAIKTKEARAFGTKAAAAFASRLPRRAGSELGT